MNLIEILGSEIGLPAKEEALARIDARIRNRESAYVCFSNVHTVVHGKRHIHYRDITNEAFLALPDGMPLVWFARLKGIRGAKRLSGPDFMLEMLEYGLIRGYSHFFYGNTGDVLKELIILMKERFPGLKVAGYISPPFRALTAEEKDKYIKYINEKKPDIVWVGLGAPKQEEWMHEFCTRLSGAVLFGVGAAFNFYSGKVRRSPLWMQSIGLEWLYRVFREPRRLLRRYLEANSLFIFYLLKELAGKILLRVQSL